MSLESAAGLGGCGCAAVQMVRKANIKRGDNVLINGGSGDLGSILVQVVKAAVGESGRVTATCSAKNVDFVRGLRAHEVVDYTAHESLAAHFADKHADDRFDAVLDTVGIQDLYVHSPAYLKEQGLFLNVGAMAVAPTWRAFLGFFAMLASNFLYPTVFGRCRMRGERTRLSMGRRRGGRLL
jgi:reticulon-4-interacting protein 1, mitochondrial